MVMEKIRTDVLVIGAGAAGIRAALAASAEGVEVTLAAKSRPGKSGSTFSPVSRGWGIQALVGEERTDRNLEAFYDDILRVGLGCCNPKLVRILVEESGDRFQDLLHWGIRFKKKPDGGFFRVKGCFSEHERAFLTEDFDLMVGCFQEILERSSIRCVVGDVIDLAMTDGVCHGALAVLNSGNVLQICAGATVLATGGGAGIFEDSLAIEDQVGDGYALAAHAGAELANMEFIQFMLGLKDGEKRRFLPLAALKRPGALVDRDGRDLLEMHIPKQDLRRTSVEMRQKHHPFSCRDVSCLIDLVVARMTMEGKPVYLYSGETRKKLPEVAHCSHAFNGGVSISEYGESTVQGLYAAGETAAGPHGADRIGGCMMTATQVFGCRAGAAAGKYAKKLRSKAFPELRKQYAGLFSRGGKDGEKDAREIAQSVRAAITRHALVLRTEKGLKSCSETLDGWEKTLWKTFAERCFSLKPFSRLRTMLSTARLVAKSALARKESLGAHYRVEEGLFHENLK